MTMEERVAVIGGGVSGLTVGVELAERGYDATIFEAAPAQCATSAVAAAIWYIYDVKGEPRASDWAFTTYDRLAELPEKTRAGVSFVEFRCFGTTPDFQPPDWADRCQLRFLERDEVSPHYDRGFAITVPLIDTNRYLPYLQGRFARAGGVRETVRPLESLERVPTAFGLVVNCSGIGARGLVPDSGVVAHRGQVVLIDPISLPYAMACEAEPTYIIPRATDCVLGGSNTESESLKPDVDETIDILKRCARMASVHADVGKVQVRVGLRPKRDRVRVERTLLQDGRSVIHNYGHGGSGFTLSWGCAKEVAELIESPMNGY